MKSLSIVNWVRWWLNICEDIATLFITSKSVNIKPADDGNPFISEWKFNQIIVMYKWSSEIYIGKQSRLG